MLSRYRLFLLVLLVAFAAGSAFAQQACAPGATCVQMLPPDFLNLSVEDAFSLGGSILAVWAVAWAFRTLSRQAWLSMEHRDTE